MTKVLMLIWAVSGSGAGLTSEIVTLDECQAAERNAPWGYSIKCVSLSS